MIYPDIGGFIVTWIAGSLLFAGISHNEESWRMFWTLELALTLLMSFVTPLRGSELKTTHTEYPVTSNLMMVASGTEKWLISNQVEEVSVWRCEFSTIWGWKNANYKVLKVKPRHDTEIIPIQTKSKIEMLE